MTTNYMKQMGIALLDQFRHNAGGHGRLKLAAICLLLASAGFLGWNWQTRAARGADRFEYYSNGKLKTHTTPGGAVVRYQYDDMGRLLGFRIPGASPAHFSYDRLGHLISIKDGSGAMELHRDEFGRIAEVKYPSGETLSYKFDPWGRIVQKALSDGYTVSYSYDLLSRVVAMDDGSGKTTFDYQTNQSVRQLPNGITTITRFSEAGAVVSLRHENRGGKLISAYSYTYAPNGKVAGEEEETPAGHNLTQYEYDLLGRLATVRSAEKILTYTYDSMGNRLSESDGKEIIRYEYDDRGRLKQRGAVSYAYNDDGNLVSKIDAATHSKTEYEYDGVGHLLAVHSGATTVRYFYDGLGNRIRREVDGKSTHYINDASSGLSQVIAELRDDGTTLHYAYGASRIVQHNTREGRKYYLTDRHGSVRQIVNERGDVVTTLQYSPFGEPLGNGKPSVDLFAFSGELWDSQTGLLYLRRRYYDPVAGRFLSKDPWQGNAANPQTLNRYAYAINDPVNFRDPSGYMFQDDGGGGDSGGGDTSTFTPPPVTVPDPSQPSLAQGFVDNWNPDSQPSLQFPQEPSLADQAKGIVSGAVNAAVNPFNVMNDSIAKVATDTAPAVEDALGKSFAPVTDAHTSLARFVGQPNNLQSLEEFAVASTDHIKGSFPNAANVGKWGGLAPAALDIGQDLIINHDPEGALIHVTEALPGMAIPTVLGNWIAKSQGATDEEIMAAKKVGFEAGLKKGPNILGAPNLARDISQFVTSGQAQQAIDAGLGAALEQALDPNILASFGGTGQPPVGGVRLDKAAELIGSLGTINGAVYDAQNGRIILIGEKNTSLPPMRLDDLAVALRAAYSSDLHDPSMSIDPDPKNPLGPTMNVAFFANTQNTHFGSVMFEADRVMKGYSVGRDNVTKSPMQSSVPGYYNVLEMQRSKGGQKPHLWSRFWLVPDRITMGVSQDGGALAFQQTKVQVKTETMRWAGGHLVSAGGEKDETAEYFAQHFTEHYDDFAKEQPVYGELKRLTQVAAVAKWMKQAGVPVDPHWFESVAAASNETPRTTPSIANEQSRSWTEGKATHRETRRVFGGTDLSVKLAFKRNDQRAAALETAVLEAAASAGDSPAFEISVNGKSQQAVAIPIMGRPRRGGFNTAETDLLVSGAGGQRLALRRFYSSFQNGQTAFGHSWSLLSPRLYFQGGAEKGKTQLIAVEGRPGTQVADQEFLLTDDYRITNLHFTQHFIDQEYGRIGFKPKAHLDGLRGLYPNQDGSFSLVFDNGNQMDFNHQGLLTQIRNQTGILQYIHEQQTGNVVEIRSVNGQDTGVWIRLHYGPQKRVGWAEASDGTQVRYAYNDSGDLAGVNGSRNRSYGYDQSHELVSLLEDGRTICRLEYDDSGRLTRQAGPNGETVRDQQTHQVADGGESIVQKAGGHTTTFFYDKALRLAAIEDDMGNSIHYTNGKRGIEKIEAANPAGRLATVEVSPDGRQTAYTDAQGTRREFRFNAEQKPLQMLVNGHVVASYSYDTAGRLEMLDYGDYRERFSYDRSGRVEDYFIESLGETSQHPHLGRVQQMHLSYDSQGHISAVSGPGLPEISFSRQKGKGVWLRWGTQTAQFSLNPQNQIDGIRGWDGATIALRYGQNGRLERMDLQKGESSGAYIFGAGRLTEIKDLAGGNTRFGYSEDGDLLNVKDAIGNKTQYVYDQQKRLSSILMSTGYRIQYAYDLAGRLRTIEEAK